MNKLTKGKDGDKNTHTHTMIVRKGEIMWKVVSSVKKNAFYSSLNKIEQTEQRKSIRWKISCYFR